jgi:hypothetical protein
LFGGNSESNASRSSKQLIQTLRVTQLTPEPSTLCINITYSLMGQFMNFDRTGISP